MARIKPTQTAVNKEREEKNEVEKCGYKSGKHCLMKNRTFPMHKCDGLGKCRYKGDGDE